MSHEVMNKIHGVITKAIASALATRPEYLTITIKKLNAIAYNDGYSVSGTYKQLEFFQEQAGQFQIDLSVDLEIESFELF